METRLVKYLRDGDKLIGAVVGLPDGSIGVSVCNTVDRFNKIRAVELASQRARNNVSVRIPARYVQDGKKMEIDGKEYVPVTSLNSVVHREVAGMSVRVQKYFRLAKENTTNAVGDRPALGTRLQAALNLLGF